MHMLINALILAVLLPVASRRAADPEPICRAELKGRRLTTAIEFPNGYKLEAPWTVLSSQHLEAPGNRQAIVADLLLDNVVEWDAATGRQLATALAAPIRLRLQAEDEPELVFQAAETWCTTVIQARRGNPASAGPALPKPGRIA